MLLPNIKRSAKKWMDSLKENVIKIFSKEKLQHIYASFVHNIASVIQSNTNIERNTGIAIKLQNEDIVMTKVPLLPQFIVVNKMEKNL